MEDENLDSVDNELMQQEINEVSVQLPTDEIETKSGVEEYIRSNPQLAESVAKLQANNISIANIIDSDPELKNALNYLANNNVKLTDVIEIPEDEEETETGTFDESDIITIDDSGIEDLSFDDLSDDDESSCADLNELF